MVYKHTKGQLYFRHDHYGRNFQILSKNYEAKLRWLKILLWSTFIIQCIKKRIIILKNFNIQTCFCQFLWVFSLKFWFKGPIISRIHLILPNAWKLMCFVRNINGNSDVKYLECDYLLVQWCVKLTLTHKMFTKILQL